MPTSVASTERNPGLRLIILKSLVRGALERLGRPLATASIVLTGDATIRALNRDYRESDQATDVLSFPLADPASIGDPARAIFLGEIYISLETARSQARAARRAYPREVAHLVIHGLLHLLGHDHRTPAERRRMAALEARLLRALRGTVAAMGSGGA